MDFFNQSAFLHALGWSLLESLWQMGCIWVLYQALAKMLASHLPRLRHRMAFFGLIAGTVWFIIDVYNHYVYLNWPGRFMAEQPVNTPALGSVTQFLQLALPFLSSLYLLAVIWLMVRLYRQYRYTHRLTATGLTRLNGELRLFVQTIAERMGIKRPIRAWISDLVDTPLTIGFWKPVILLPVALVNQLSVRQAEAIILHELQHIRRNDFLVNLVIAFSDILLFFNPFARLFSDLLRREREHICDDMVLQFRYDAQAYAKALLMLEKSRHRQPVLAIAANGNSDQFLLHRVRRMLLKEKPSDRFSARLLGFLFLAVLIGSFSWLRPGFKQKRKSLEEIVVTGYPANPSKSGMAAAAAPVQKAFPETEFIREIKTPVNHQPSGVEREKPGPQRLMLKPSPEQRESLAVLEENPANIWQVALTENREESPAVTVSGGTAVHAVYSFASGVQQKEYAFCETEAPESVNTAGSQPYVPGKSFYSSPQALTDTGLPAVYLENLNQAEEKILEEQARQAVKAVDWKKVQKELEGKKLNEAQIKAVIEKAMTEVDWASVNRQVEEQLQKAAQEARQKYLAALARYRQFYQQQTLQNQRLQLQQQAYPVIVSEASPSGLSQSDSCRTGKKIKKIVVL